MEFNPITRGAKRAANDESTVFAILDAGFLCHVGFQHEGETMMIPTAYGRKDNELYLHGSTKNFMLNQIINGQTVCIAVTHLDGIVLASTLFDTSVNYRSVVLYGKAELVEDENMRMEGLKIITESVCKGRWDEVPVGDANQIKATMLVKFNIEKASAKFRNEGPNVDVSATHESWSGHIPLVTKALTPIPDALSINRLPLTKSITNYLLANQKLCNP